MSGPRVPARPRMTESGEYWGWGVVASFLLRGTPYRRVVSRLYLLALWALSALPLVSSEFPDTHAADRILRQIERSPSLEENLRFLCDEVGGRMVGTPNMSRAVDWAVEAFRAAGGLFFHLSFVRIRRVLSMRPSTHGSMKTCRVGLQARSFLGFIAASTVSALFGQACHA